MRSNGYLILALLLTSLPGRAEAKTMKQGTFRNGTYRNGTFRNGTLRNGTYRNGTLRNGTYRNGTFRNGTLRNGTFRNGNLRQASGLLTPNVPTSGPAILSATGLCTPVAGAIDAPGASSPCNYGLGVQAALNFEDGTIYIGGKNASNVFVYDTATPENAWIQFINRKPTSGTVVYPATTAAGVNYDEWNVVNGRLMGKRGTIVEQLPSNTFLAAYLFTIDASDNYTVSEISVRVATVKTDGSYNGGDGASVTAAMRSNFDEADDHLHYKLQIWAAKNTAGSDLQWRNLCGPLGGDLDQPPEPADSAYGIFVSGSFETMTGDYKKAGVTFSCDGGVVAKVARLLGYAPHKRYGAFTPAADTATPWGQKLFTSGVRALMSDSCENDTSQTLPGTAVDVGDGDLTYDDLRKFVRQGSSDANGYAWEGSYYTSPTWESTTDCTGSFDRVDDGLRAAPTVPAACGNWHYDQGANGDRFLELPSQFRYDNIPRYEGLAAQATCDATNQWAPTWTDWSNPAANTLAYVGIKTSTWCRHAPSVIGDGSPLHPTCLRTCLNTAGAQYKINANQWWGYCLTKKWDSACVAYFTNPAQYVDAAKCVDAAANALGAGVTFYNVPKPAVSASATTSTVTASWTWVPPLQSNIVVLVPEAMGTQNFNYDSYAPTTATNVKSDDAFTFSSVYPGRYRVRILDMSNPALPTVYAESPVVQVGTPGAPLVSATNSGNAVTVRFSGMPNAYCDSVKLWSTGTRWNTTLSVNTKTQGSVQFANVPYGLYQVDYFSCTGAYLATSSIQVRGNPPGTAVLYANGSAGETFTLVDAARLGNVIVNQPFGGNDPDYGTHGICAYSFNAQSLMGVAHFQHWNPAVDNGFLVSSGTYRNVEFDVYINDFGADMQNLLYGLRGYVDDAWTGSWSWSLYNELYLPAMNTRRAGWYHIKLPISGATVGYSGVIHASFFGLHNANNGVLTNLGYCRLWFDNVKLTP
jgi:hypothetical protein